MSSFEYAAHLNCEGARLLSCGASGQAFKIFRTALETMTREESQGQRQDLSMILPRSQTLTQANESHEYSIPKRSTEEVHSNGLTSVELKFFQDGQSFVYCRAFVFNLEIDFSLCCATIMFNMALSLHMKDKCMNIKAQRKALRLYDLSLALLGESSSGTDCYNVALAVLNNKAQLYYEFCEFGKAREVLDVVMNVISSAEDGDPLDERDVEGFLLNVMLLRPPTVARAA